MISLYVSVNLSMPMFAMTYPKDHYEVIQPFEKREDSAKWLKTLPKEINHEHYPNQCNRRAI